MSRYFLVHGWWSFAGYAIVYALGLFVTIRALPQFAIGLTVVDRIPRTQRGKVDRSALRHAAGA